MLGTFVPITISASPQAQLLKNFAQTAANLIAQSENLLGIMNNAISGQSGGTQFAKLEQLFGLTTGDGQTVFNIVNGSSEAINGTATNTQIVNAANQMG